MTKDRGQPGWWQRDGTLGLSLVSPKHGRDGSHSPQTQIPAPLRPLELLSSEGAAPNLPQGPQLCPRGHLVPPPPVPRRGLGTLGTARAGCCPCPWAAQGLARCPRDIFIPAFVVLFEAVGSVSSAINTTLPCLAPLGDNSNTLSDTAWLPWVTPRWPWDVWLSPNPLPVQGKPPLSPCQAGRSPRGSGHSGPCGFGALGCPHLELPKDGESGAVPALVTAVGVTKRAQLGTTTTTTRFLREKGFKNRD